MGPESLHPFPANFSHFPPHFYESAALVVPTITLRGSAIGPLMKSCSTDMEFLRTNVILKPAAYFIEVPV